MPRVKIQKDFDKKKMSIVQSALDILLEEGVDKLSVNYLLRKTKNQFVIKSEAILLFYRKFF